VGVIPGRRRQGIGRQMMLYLMDQARAHHLNRVNLEVIEANQGAHALYHQLGFVDHRMLISVECLEAKIVNVSPDYQVKELPAAELLDYFTAFHDQPNCWQRGLPSLKAMEAHLQGWASFQNGDLTGLCAGLGE